MSRGSRRWWPIAAALVLASCAQDSPGTSVRIALGYADSLALDTADVTLSGRTQSAVIAHELLLLVADDLAGTTVPIEIWGRSGVRRLAYASTTATPVRDQVVSASLELVACEQRCEGAMLMGCAEPVSCALGCSEDGEAHCIVPRPSNGVDASLVDAVHDAITISADATFDVDTGAITQDPVLGTLARTPGEGIDAGIGYYQADPVASTGVPLGIFVFHDLTVDQLATVRFTGTRAVVLLVGDTATIAGTLDVSGGRGAQRTPGPGGGAGGFGDIGPGGCGPGVAGQNRGLENGGGGGGGGSVAGGPGGHADLVGVGGPACLAPLLEPLRGGSGGGRGGRGAGPKPSGGGGGGALQITALGQIVVAGVISAGGAGGDPGALTSSDGGGGGGGGAGGAVLLEAPVVMAQSRAVIAANGGGGGGGGGDGVTTPPIVPAAGANGRLDGDGAGGGIGGETLNNGGTGGATGGADTGNDGIANGGGGGGAQGAIAIRGHTVTVMATTSPHANTADLPPPR